MNYPSHTLLIYLTHIPLCSTTHPLVTEARQFEDSRVLGSQRTEETSVRDQEISVRDQEISVRDQEISVCYQQHARYERELQDSASRYGPDLRPDPSPNYSPDPRPVLSSDPNPSLMSSYTPPNTPH